MASPQERKDMEARYHEWCLDRLMEDRLDCCQVPPQFRALSEVDDD